MNRNKGAGSGVVSRPAHEVSALSEQGEGNPARPAPSRFGGDGCRLVCARDPRGRPCGGPLLYGHPEGVWSEAGASAGPCDACGDGWRNRKVIGPTGWLDLCGSCAEQWVQSARWRRTPKRDPQNWAMLIGGRELGVYRRGDGFWGIRFEGQFGPGFPTVAEAKVAVLIGFLQETPYADVSTRAHVATHLAEAEGEVPRG